MAIVAGVLFGGIAILGMTFPAKLEPGVFFDARSIILPLAGIFGGPLAGIVAGAMAGFYRFWLGGSGAIIGVSTCVLAMAVGLIYRYMADTKRIDINVWTLLLMSGFVHIGEIILFAFLPEQVSQQVLNSVALPIILIFIPATAILGMIFLVIEEQIITKDELLKVRTEQAKALEKPIEVLSSALASRDPLTIGHENEVAKISARIGKKLGYDEHRLEGLHIVAMVHDFGNIRIPTDILVKPSNLLPEEFDIIRSHADAGADLLKGIDFDWPVQEIIRQHHERVDGSGTRYDPKIVDACLRLIEQGEI